MNKKVYAEDLAVLVHALITDPDAAGELVEYAPYQQFLTAIAEAVCDACGGEIREPADDEPSLIGDRWFVEAYENDSLPEDGGVWKRMELLPGLQKVEKSPGDLTLPVVIDGVTYRVPQEVAWEIEQLRKEA